MTIYHDAWTNSIAVGGRTFVENVKALLRFRVKGRQVVECGEEYQLREDAARYRAVFDATGAKLLQLPMTPDRVKTALKGA